MSIRIGTSGWDYDHWKERFYPADLPRKHWFAHFARHFDTVEINNSFYHLPKDKTWRHWADAAPEGFVYAVKGNRFITHNKKLRDPAEPVGRFIDGARLLGEHLGPVLWQLPGNWRADVGRLEAFLGVLPDDLRHAFEFRDASWWQSDAVLQALDDHGAAFVSHDMPGNPSPKLALGDFVYCRFHGAHEKYGGGYGRALAPWTRWLRNRRDEGWDIYAYFNNDAEAHAVFDAQKLAARL
jgi:uncharacterized protein YecE (DUF72 family)